MFWDFIDYRAPDWLTDFAYFLRFLWVASRRAKRYPEHNQGLPYWYRRYLIESEEFCLESDDDGTYRKSVDFWYGPGLLPVILDKMRRRRMAVWKDKQGSL